ncbi:MAG: EAL domain-containing protein [Pseudomonadota bacterium]
MSMQRQLWFTILACMLIALAASLSASLLNARAYLEAQLAQKNQDNAAALALALSQGDGGREQAVLAATALFDSGHYELIQIIDPEGKVVVDKVVVSPDPGAPAWFVALFPIRSLPGRAEIAQGWQPLGTLTLMSGGEFAYQSLWNTALTMSGVSLLAAVLAGLLASLVLRRLGRPMAAVMEQARAINEHRFVTMPEPDVPEFRALAAAMNDTVSRLREDFEADAARFETMRREANHDPLTGLANRDHFLASLEASLHGENAGSGSLAVIRLRKLGKLNRALGRQVADQVLRRVGATLEALLETCPEFLAGRLNGADFALLLPAGCAVKALLDELLLDLHGAMDNLAGDYSTIYIGHADYGPGDDPKTLLARIDATLAAIDLSGGSGVRAAAAPAAGEGVGGETWRMRIQQALATPDSLRLARFPLRLAAGSALHRECPLRLKDPATGEWLGAGSFLPFAERLGLVRDLDLAALDLALADLAEDDNLAGLWLNLSAKSLADPEYRRRLLERLEAHPDVRGRLRLEVPEAGGLARLDALRELARDLKPLGCGLGLEHYGHHFHQIGRLYDLGLDFLKVDASFIRGLDGHPGNQHFLAGLIEIAHRIGVQVHAEGVERDEELASVLALGFDGASGPAIH